MRKALILAAVMFFSLASPGIRAQETPGEGSNASAELTTSSAVIGGIPTLKFGKRMDCTFFGALNACLRHLGEQVSYEYLMGVSGAAFGTRFRTDWSPTSADAGLNDDHAKPALDAVGYSCEWIGSGMTDAAEIVMASIDAGVPIVATRLVGYADWGLIVGYNRGGDSWLCRTYHDKSGGYTEVTKLPPSMLLLGGKRTALSMTDSVKRSIKLAVQFGKGEKKLSDARFEVGFKGYDAWVSALESPSLGRLPARDAERIAQINAWLYGCLIDARTAGVSYLRWAEKLLPDGEKKAVMEAADAYQEELDILNEARRYAPYPSEVKDGPCWTAEIRREQVKALKAALEKEKEAIAALEKAVSIIETPPDPGQES